jgi:glucan-binding YG repeat protein
MLSNSTLTIDGKSVKIDSIGRIKTKGLINIDGNKYYFNDYESPVLDKVVDIPEDGKTYTYKFDQNGEALIGWIPDGDDYYLFDKDCHMIKDAFVEWKGLYFYLDEKGVMAKNKYVAWKNGWRLRVDSYGSVDINVFGESERAQFISELTSY